MEQHSTRRERGSDDQGAAMIEFALVASLLFMILFGIVEFGFVFRERLTIANATQSAARVGATLGADDYADIEMLRSLDQSLSTLTGASANAIQYVDVFSANALGEPQSPCGGGGTHCNRYYYQPASACGWSPCPDPDGGYSSFNWAPSGRDDSLPGLDVMGIRVSYAHTWLTGGLVPLPDVSCTGGSACWADTALMRLEPKAFE